ncbi:TonB-dependent siderophore receptor [Sphingobium cloacae]|uniref:Secretin/TonB short N-terminal domain-containing protein n=1 Tax=Sphingobium cloacae TaxID=120107 RepID=A0A1E1F090_9SPHN|nr:TonB-dependent receptor [Sphingobium cloacae]BAV63936.1 hypothetical protein SCLO_1008960 [Sphingobium cloacae]
MKLTCPRHPASPARGIALALLATTSLSVAALSAAPAYAQQATSYDIAAGPLPTVLNQFARQAHVELIYDAPLTQSATSSGLKGSFGAAEGLSRILAGTGLTYRQTGPNMFTLERAPTADAGAVQLGPVRVEGGSDTYASGGSLPSSAATTERTKSYTTNAVTIGKTVLNPRDIPQSVSVVTRQRIEDQNLFTLSDAMAQATGVSISTNGTQRNSYTVRGFEVGILQIDGLPTRLDTDTLLSADLSMYDRVEVLRGPNGLLQGTGDPSASVNLVRKRPTSELAISGAVSAGSWNNYRAELDVGGPLDKAGRLRVRVVGSFQDNDYFYDVAHQRRWLVYGIAEYDLTDTTKITAGYNYMGSRSTPTLNGLPRATTGADLNFSRSTFLDSALNRFRFNDQEAFAEISQSIGRWNAKAVFRRATGHNNLYSVGVFGAANPVTGLGPRLNYLSNPDYRDKQTGIDAFLTGPLRLFGRDHTILIGGTARIRKNGFSYENMSPVTPPPPVNVFNFDPYAVPEYKFNGVYSFRVHGTDKEAGIYATARLSISDSLTVILGSRLSWWENQALYDQPALLYFPPEISKKNAIFTPYGGLVFKVDPDTSLYASYADIFQPQSATDYTGGILPPVVGKNYELGIKRGLFEDRLNVSFALFQIEQTNRAITDPDHEDFSVAQGKVRSRGFEAEATGDLAHDWKVSAGYTYTETKYIRDPDAQGQVFNSTTPKHLFKVWTDYTLPSNLKAWSVGAGVQFQTRFYVDDGAFRLVQGSYALANARIAYQISPNLSASVNVNNIFDKRYYTTLTGIRRGNYYGEPRSFMISLRGKY